MATIDRTIAFDEDLYTWLLEYVPSIRPATTLPKFINWLVEMERERIVNNRDHLANLIEYYEKRIENPDENS